MDLKTVRDHSDCYLDEATRAGLMHSSFTRHSSTQIEVKGTLLTSFLNCSYLNLDMHPDIIRAAQDILKKYGVHYCCSRARLSMNELFLLEERLSHLLKGRAITFPSVTTAHSAVFPLIYNDVLYPNRKKAFVFDQFAHSSMQVHIESFSSRGPVTKIRHNDMIQLEEVFKKYASDGFMPFYFADGVYSVGSSCPVNEVIRIADSYGGALYIDDAHGTLLFGEDLEGYVASHFKTMPANVLYNFSLAKGFGCNGGGLVVSDLEMEKAIRRFSVQYNFSGPLDFAIVGAALKCFDLLDDGEIRKRVTRLRANIRNFDAYLKCDAHPYLPIRMIKIGDEGACLKVGKDLLDDGLLVSTAFFPVVRKDQAQLRICLTSDHTPGDIDLLCSKLISHGHTEIMDNRRF